MRCIPEQGGDNSRVVILIPVLYFSHDSNLMTVYTPQHPVSYISSMEGVCFLVLVLLIRISFYPTSRLHFIDMPPR